MSKINFRNLKLKSHEEYLICRTYFCYVKDLIFKLKRKVEKGERNDEMTRRSKFKACTVIRIFRVAKSGTGKLVHNLTGS